MPDNNPGNVLLGTKQKMLNNLIEFELSSYDLKMFLVDFYIFVFHNTSIINLLVPFKN